VLRVVEEEDGPDFGGKPPIHVGHGRFVRQFRRVAQAPHKYHTVPLPREISDKPFPCTDLHALAECIHRIEHLNALIYAEESFFFRVVGDDDVERVEDAERAFDDIEVPSRRRVKAPGKYCVWHVVYCNVGLPKRSTEALAALCSLAEDVFVIYYFIMRENGVKAREYAILASRDIGQPPKPFLLRLSWAFFSALLFALAQPNELFLYGNWLLGLFCLVPLYLALEDTQKIGEASLIGALFGATNHALTSYWLFFYKNFAFWTLGTTTIAYAVVYAAAIMYGWFMLKHAGIARPVVFALAWAAFEYAKSTGFLGYPWGLLPYSFTNVAIMLQTADIWGVYGISAFLALCSASIAELFLPQWPKKPGQNRMRLRWVTISAVYGLILLAYGANAMSHPVPVRSTVRLLLCQQNTDPWISGENAALESNIRLAKDALKSNEEAGGAKPDLMVFSESSLQRPFKEYRAWFEKNPPDSPLLPFLQKTDIPLLTGLPVVINWDTYEASNSVGLIYPSGILGETYAKMHPVPFAEAIPFWEFSWFRTFVQKVIGLERGWVMGEKPVIFSLTLQNRDAVCSDIRTLPSVKFAAPICFEDAFAGQCRGFVLRGADLLINLTNDSWSRTLSAQIQHYAVARFRAIESRKALVRSTNAGVTCVVGADGRNLVELPQFKAESIIVDVPLYASPLTFYMRLGDWFAWTCVGFVGLLFVWAILREKKIV